MKIESFLNKYLMYAIYLLLFFSFVGSMRSCSTNKEVKKMRKELDALHTTMDKDVYTKEEMDIRMSIEGYEISKRMLYDQNAIVRTVARPDDRMNEYDGKINELRQKIK